MPEIQGDAAPSGRVALSLSRPGLSPAVTRRLQFWCNRRCNQESDDGREQRRSGRLQFHAAHPRERPATCSSPGGGKRATASAFSCNEACEYRPIVSTGVLFRANSWVTFTGADRASSVVYVCRRLWERADSSSTVSGICAA